METGDGYGTGKAWRNSFCYFGRSQVTNQFFGYVQQGIVKPNTVYQLSLQQRPGPAAQWPRSWGTGRNPPRTPTETSWTEAGWTRISGTWTSGPVNNGHCALGL
jgi:hypothetical protein